MKICIQSYVVVLGYIVCYSAADPIITTTSSLNGYGVFENSSEVTLICTIQPYDNILRWRINSSLAADCLVKNCNSYIAGRYTFAFDTGNGMFNLTINVVTFDDNGITFECYDGTSTTNLTAIVKEKKTSIVQTVISGRGLSTWCIAIICTCSIIGVFIIQIVIVVVIRERRISGAEKALETMEKERNEKRDKLQYEIKKRDSKWKICIGNQENMSNSMTAIEKDKRKKLGTINGEERQNSHAEEALEAMEKERNEERTKLAWQKVIQTKGEKELTRRKNEITKRFKPDKKLMNMHEKMKTLTKTMIKREKKEMELRRDIKTLENTYIKKIEEEIQKQTTQKLAEIDMRRSMRKRKAPTHFDPDAAGIPSKPAPAPQQAPVPQPAPVMPQPVPAPQPDPAAVVPAPVGIEHPQEATDPGNQHNDTDEKLTVENVRKKLKEKRQVLYMKRLKREKKYSDLRTQIETKYSQIIKKEEENLKQLEKEEKKENLNTTDPGMSKVKEKKKVLNEDKKLKYYRIKRKILGIQRESREMAVQLEIAELEDEYGGEEEVENTDHQRLVSQEEYLAERQSQFSLEEYRVVDQLRTEIDKKEEMLETKMKWVEKYLEQQRNKGDKCKWFIPIYDVCLLSKHPSENSKGPQNKGGVIHKLIIQEAMGNESVL